MASLTKFKYYENSIEANFDRQILEENGVQSFIANEQTIQSDWLLSQALGGIQLQVFEDELEKAKEILENYYKNERVEIEVEHTISNPDFDFVCPKCGSNHIYRDEKPGGLFGISFLIIGIPIKTKSQVYHCYFCNNEFKN